MHDLVSLHTLYIIVHAVPGSKAAVLDSNFYILYYPASLPSTSLFSFCEALVMPHYLLMFHAVMVNQIFQACYRVNTSVVISLSCFHSSIPNCASKKIKMPPKKSSSTSEKKILLGRPGNNLKIGIVGLFRPISPVDSHQQQIRVTECWKVVFLQCFVGHRLVAYLIYQIQHSQCTVDLGKAANFPYATIDPEEARIPVPDPRFDWLCEAYKPVSKVPAFLTCIDIAGLMAVCASGIISRKLLMQDRGLLLAKV